LLHRAASSHVSPDFTVPFTVPTQIDVISSVPIAAKVSFLGVVSTPWSSPATFFAVVVMKEMQQHGMKVPDDVAVVGYDDETYCESLIDYVESSRKSSWFMGSRTIDDRFRS
jgi:hypothetical protein